MLLKIGVRERVRMVVCCRGVCVACTACCRVFVALGDVSALGLWVRNVGSLLCVVLHALVMRGCCEVASSILVLRDDEIGPW